MYTFVKDSEGNSSLVQVAELHYQSKEQKMIMRSSHGDLYEANVNTKDAKKMMIKLQKKDNYWAKGYVFDYLYKTNVKFMM